MIIKNFIKSLLSFNAYTIKRLAEEMTARSDKEYTQSSLSHRINRESLTLKEAYLIADILDYKIKFYKESADGREEIFFP